MQVSAAGANGGPGIGLELPDIGECPVCHHAIQALPAGIGLHGPGPRDELQRAEVELQVLLRCPRATCHRIFIARYRSTTRVAQITEVSAWKLHEIYPRVPVSKLWPPEVVTLSSRFVEIFGQASAAEAGGLDLICGPGYRKALEFLIKDFAKHKNPEYDAKIEAANLAKCIKDYVDNEKLKTTSLRAAWLGNDETHYVRQWAEKDLGDLKKTIDSTAYWVSQELSLEELEASMPDPKKGPPGV